MKQRITYLVKDPDSFVPPEQLDVKGASFTLNKLKAAKEHRITFGLSELPKELSKAFEQWHELHIRWATDRPYTAIPPFTSRVTPGLHVFFTPHKGQQEGPLCDDLQSIFGPGLKCNSTSESAIKLPILSERFSMSASSQYYSYLPSLSNLVNYIQEKICKSTSKACKDAALSLFTVSYLDIDYDTISHAVILNAFWDSAPNSEHWTETHSLPNKDSTIEIGVLIHEQNPDPEDIGFGGFLTVLGRDDGPKPTRFQTPTRHYPLSESLTYTTTFQKPIGLHPTLQLSFTPSTSLTPPQNAKSCKLHAYLTLPSYVFIDKYQFTDSLFLDSHNLVSLRSIHGATDLEAPDWVIPQWGSAALFELAPPVEKNNDSRHENYNVTIPVHLRYLPASPSSHTRVPVPWPVVFWACRADEGAKMAASPFDRMHLGYETLFGPKTRFMHVAPAEKGNGTGGLVEWIDVPVLDLRGTKWVEMGTVGAVVFAFLGLCWVLFADSAWTEKSSGSAAASKGKDKAKGRKKD